MKSKIWIGDYFGDNLWKNSDKSSEKYPHEVTVEIPDMDFYNMVSSIHGGDALLSTVSTVPTTATESILN